jgi:hypothetical protein
LRIKLSQSALIIFLLPFLERYESGSIAPGVSGDRDNVFLYNQIVVCDVWGLCYTCGAQILPPMTLSGINTGVLNVALSTRAQERNPSIPSAGLMM